MKKMLIFFCCVFNHLYAQNLIADGGFETLYYPNHPSCTTSDPDLQCQIPVDRWMFQLLIPSSWQENSGNATGCHGPSLLDARYASDMEDNSFCGDNNNDQEFDDLSIPSTFLGTQEHRGGANAGIRYVALENGLFRSDGIAAELTQELVKGRDYRLKFYAVKKGSANKDHKIQIQFRF